MEYFSRDYYCLAPDLPGHGKTRISGNEQDYLMERFAPVFIEFLQAQHIDGAALIGYSMGGRFAQYLLIRYPQFWQKIVLESTSPGLKKASERRNRIENDNKLAAILQQGRLSDFLQDWYRQPLFSSLIQTANFQALFKQRLQNNPHELASCLRMMSTGRQPSLWVHLPEIKIPVLLMAGELDAKYSAVMLEMKKICINADLKIIKQAGHTIHYEQPLVFKEFLSNFLAEHRRT
jgi:2-succinyl-6-hydroxy-2,4-cyclohexadiene-1-carboxylate synthase